MFFTIIVFFGVLGLLVLVHEIGHFFTARRGGIKVDEFGLGMPPRIIGLYKDEAGKWKIVGPKTGEIKSTIWSLNWVPLGGFVKIKGEEGDSAEDQDSFASKSVGRRMWVLSAGVLMNVLLAIVLLSIGLAIGSPQILDQEDLPPVAKISNAKIRVMEVLANSPASDAGLEVADSILEVDNITFTQIESLQNYVDEKVGEEISLKIEREQEVFTASAVVEILEETERGGIGVALVRTGFVSYPWYISWWYGIIETLKMIGGVLMGFFLIIKSLIASQELIGEVYGPVGIATLVGDAARLGILYLIQFTAALSIIIAVINFLPFPALDGGRVFFLIIEALRGKPINQKFEAAMHNIGFALLMLLVLIVTYRDIARISSGFVGWWDKLANIF